jgi:CheY-like chemotaxis protein
MHHRIALCGFSEFEHRALHFSLQTPSSDDMTRYEVVDDLSDADYAVVDADSSPAVMNVVASGRLPHTVFVGLSAPWGAGAHLARPIDPTRIRRMLDELTARSAAPRARSVPPPDSVLPTLDDEVEAPLPAVVSIQVPAAEAELRLDLTPAAPAASAARAAPATSAVAQEPPLDARHAAKAAARAKARQRRLAGGAEQTPTDALRDVLVLDRDEPAGMLLCDLLERFGFDATWVRSTAQATAQLGMRRFAAFFLDMVLDDEGLVLVQRIHELPATEGRPAPAVLLVASRLNPADRVRATLAGFGAPLIKPVTRGDAARALESCGVLLPSDARRH